MAKSRHDTGVLISRGGISEVLLEGVETAYSQKVGSLTGVEWVRWAIFKAGSAGLYEGDEGGGTRGVGISEYQRREPDLLALSPKSERGSRYVACSV